MTGRSWQREPLAQAPAGGGIPLGHTRLEGLPASPPSSRDRTGPGTAGVAVLSKMCPSCKQMPAWDTYRLQKGNGVKVRTENVPENAGPLLTGAATEGSSCSFSGLASQVKVGAGTTPPRRSQHGSPRLV